MKPSKILSQAKSLIDRPERWIRGDPFAIDANGERVSEDDPRAVAWCPLGAIIKIQISAGIALGIADVARYLEAVIPRHVIGPWNRKRNLKHADVMRAFDRAIALALIDEL